MRLVALPGSNATGLGDIKVNFVVIGTDHRMQHSDLGLKGLLRAIVERRHIEALIAIAEEYHEAIGHTSVARSLAEEHQLRWYNLDMTTQEKQDAGILQEQLNRPSKFRSNVTYRLASDDIREAAWVEKLTPDAVGTTIVICGYLHFEALVQRLRERGCAVDKLVYLETVPTIRMADTVDTR
jgi:hypothetical protein